MSSHASFGWPATTSTRGTTVRDRPVVLVGAREPGVRRLVAAALKPASFDVRGCDGGDELVDRAFETRPDAVVVDWPAIELDRITELQAAASCRVLLLDAAPSPARAASGLDAGADAYVPRPFNPTELAARIRSVIRRDAARLSSGRRRVGRAMVDLRRRQVQLPAHSRALRREEWSILCHLLEREGRVVPHEELLGAAYGNASRDELQRLPVLIRNLRRKLGIYPWDEGPIRTIRGRGYAFDPEERIPRINRHAPWAEEPTLSGD